MERDGSDTQTRRLKDTKRGLGKGVYLWIVLLSCLSAGCGKRVSYVRGDHQLVRLESGQTAPHAGVLMSEGYLSEIYEALGETGKPRERCAEKTCPVPAILPPVPPR